MAKLTCSQGSTTLYGYPRDVFPPTDFHTATLIGDHYIYIVGSCAYSSEPGREAEPGHDENTTPIYRLDTRDFSIQKVKVTGEQPAMIHHHKAKVLHSGKIEVTRGMVSEGSTTIENVHTYTLDTQKKEWSRNHA